MQKWKRNKVLNINKCLMTIKAIEVAINTMSGLCIWLYSLHNFRLLPCDARLFHMKYPRIAKLGSGSTNTSGGSLFQFLRQDIGSFSSLRTKNSERISTFRASFFLHWRWVSMNQGYLLLFQTDASLEPLPPLLPCCLLGRSPEGPLQHSRPDQPSTTKENISRCLCYKGIKVTSFTLFF